MQICIILLGGLMALTEPSAGRGEQAPPTAPAAVPADAALMKQLQTRIESIPEPDRVRLGVEILVEHAEQFQSDFFRNRVYLSIGDLYKQQGDTERALEYFGKAGGAGAEVIGSISRNRVFDLLESQGLQADIPARAIASRDHLQVSDQEYADLTHRAAFALISSGKRAQAVDLAIQAAEQRPCDRTFHVLETVSVSADRPDDRAPLLRGMHWLARNSGEFGRTLRFLGNLAHAEEVAGNIDEAARIRLEIVAGFPQSSEICYDYLSLARWADNRGDQQAVREYLTKAVEGNGGEACKQSAGRWLESILTGKPSPEPFIPQELSLRPDEWNRLMLIVLNVLVGGSILAYYWLRKRSRAGLSERP